jgi:acetolactate synthase-1/2/3 large subunit
MRDRAGGRGPFGAGEIAALAERLAAPVITTFGARGLVPPEHPCAVRWPPHVPEVGSLWDESDLVVAIGTDFDGSTTQNWAMPRPPSLLAINVDAADASKNYRRTSSSGAAGSRDSSRRPPREGLDELEGRSARWRGGPRASRATSRRRRVPRRAQRVVPDDTVYVVVCASPGAGSAASTGSARPLATLGRGRSGSGSGGDGAAAGSAGRVVAVCGDGGFLYACGDLATLAGGFR